MRRTLILLVILFAAAARAQVVRTFVATTGSDAAPCSRTQPCRTFGTAIAAVDNAGEVVALDSGGYGPFVVTRSVSIIAPAGIHAAVAPTALPAVTVNAGAGNEVVLRGLYLNSQGSSSGILFNSGDVLHVEQTVVSGFSSLGISLSRSLADQDGDLFVTDSIVRGGNGTGVFVGSSDAGSMARALLENCRLESNITGLEVESRTHVILTRSVVSANLDGIEASSTLTGVLDSANVTVDRSFVTNNLNQGIATRVSPGTSNIWISSSAVTDNNVGIRNADGVIRTAGNSTVTGNTTSDVVGLLTAQLVF